MKALFLTLIMTFSMQAQALSLSPEQMTPQQQAQLIQVLNQLQPEMLNTLLSEEGMDWYIDQFTRQSNNPDIEGSGQVSNGQIDWIGEGYDDPNAPQLM